MDLDRYLERIGYAGPVRPDAECLAEIHRHHLLAIAYENVDVQLRRRLDLDPARIFDKLVNQRRGGWCYEMNGLLYQALVAIGFEVTRLAGGVMRSAMGDDTFGNHLVLRVDLDEPWLADVGLGDGALEPLRLRAGAIDQGPRSYALETLGPDEWRFRNHEGAIPPDFDFTETPDEALLERTCVELQDDPSSLFRQNLIVMRPDGAGGSFTLIGRVLASPGEEKRVLDDAAELESVLNEVFGIEDPELRDLWPGVAARHAELFGE